MSSLLIHPQTKLKVTGYLNQPTHALLLTGEEGSGKLHLSKWLGDQLQLTRYIVEAEEGKSAISIDQVRDLYTLTKTGSALLVIIKDAHNLSKEAQNAFLKLLEEPPKEVRFILTTDNNDAILSTIRSRSQEIRILPLAKREIQNYTTESNLSETELQSLLYTSKGLPGRLLSVLEDEELRSTTQAAVAEVKQFYVSDSYSRHLICLQHNYDKLWAETLLETLNLIVSTLFKTAVSASTIKKLRKQANLLEETAQNVLKNNGNPKIHLARLAQEL